MRAVRAGGHRRGSPRYSYNADSAGLVDGTGYPARIWGWDLFVDTNLVRRFSIQEDDVACIRDHLSNL
jgi:hypothetical protein